MTTLYPSGYGTQLLTLPQLVLRHCTQAEPETVLRLIDLLVSHGGLLGIGSGQRPCPSDTSDASRECKSFHQLQQFAPITPNEPPRIYFAAFDMVYRHPLSTPMKPLPHIAPPTGVIPVQGTPAASLPDPYTTPAGPGTGIHANVGVPGKPGWESWHAQPTELDGFDTWAAAGRKRPFPILTNYNNPPDPVPPLPPLDLTIGPFMLSTYHPLATPQRFFDTRGFGVPSMPAGEYGVLPPYPASNTSPPMPTLNDGTPIRGVKAGVKIITPTFTGFATAYTYRGNTPGTSILDFPQSATPSDSPQTPPAYNCLIDIPISDASHPGEFCVFINVPAHIAIDLYGYWT